MKPKTNSAGSVYVPQGKDACQTPGYAVVPLVKYLPKEAIIWEPACGEYYLVKALLDAGYTATFSDLIYGSNFFSFQPVDPWHIIVTNPPYSIKYRWLARCYELAKPFALLMPVETLGAAKAQRLFERFGIEIILLDKRVNFKMPNKGWSGTGAQFPVAWFTWGLNIGQPITYAKLHRKALSAEQTQNTQLALL